MYGIPKRENFSFLDGSSISDIKLHDAADRRRNDYYILIFLDSGQQIHIEGGYKIVDYSKNKNNASINDLMGLTIDKVQVRGDSEMVIKFINDIDLHLFDDDPDFECIHFYPENIII